MTNKQVFPLPKGDAGITAGSDRTKCLLPSGEPPLPQHYLEFKGSGICPKHCTFYFNGSEITMVAHDGGPRAVDSLWLHATAITK